MQRIGHMMHSTTNTGRNHGRHITHGSHAPARPRPLPPPPLCLDLIFNTIYLGRSVMGMNRLTQCKQV